MHYILFPQEGSISCAWHANSPMPEKVLVMGRWDFKRIEALHLTCYTSYLFLFISGGGANVGWGDQGNKKLGKRNTKTRVTDNPPYRSVHVSYAWSCKSSLLWCLYAAGDELPTSPTRLPWDFTHPNCHTTPWAVIHRMQILHSVCRVLICLEQKVQRFPSITQNRFFKILYSCFHFCRCYKPKI